MVLDEVERERQVQQGMGHGQAIFICCVSGRIFVILSHNGNSLLATDHL